MASLKLLDLKHRITGQINQIEEKAAEEARKLLKSTKANPDPDDSLVPVRPLATTPTTNRDVNPTQS